MSNKKSDLLNYEMIDSYSTLNALLKINNRFSDGNKVKILEDNRLYEYNNKTFFPIDNSNFKMNLYDINKSIMENNTKELDKAEGLRTIKKYITDNKNKSYHMLMCRENNYYTVFAKEKNNFKDKKDFSKAVYSCFTDMMKLLDVSYNRKTNSVEFWIKDTNKNIVSCYFLFPYDEGVITY